MPRTKSLHKSLLCIICKKRKRHQAGYLFCKRCSNKGVFIKIAALRDSKEYKDGRLINIGRPQKGGRLHSE